MDKQFKFKSNDLERESDLSNQIQDRLDNILELMKENTQPFPDKLMVEKPIEVIPNDPLSTEKIDTKTKDIFFDDSYFDNIQFFRNPLVIIENILK